MCWLFLDFFEHFFGMHGHAIVHDQECLCLLVVSIGSKKFSIASIHGTRVADVEGQDIKVE